MIDLGHLDVNLVTHCNKRCVSCSHASPFAAPWSMPAETLERDLAALKKVVHFQRIQMVGGEPLLHRGIVEMMGISRASGIANEVMVITNGKLLPRMGLDFWQTFDSLQLSIYPGLDPETPGYAQRMCAQFNKPFYSTVYTEFHRQFRDPPGDGSNFHHCHWKSDCWTVHDGHFYLCPQSAFFPKAFMGLEANVDGLSLEDLTDEKFAAFIGRKEPLNACRICLANEMKPAPWREAKTIEEWREASTLRT